MHNSLGKIVIWHWFSVSFGDEIELILTLHGRFIAMSGRTNASVAPPAPIVFTRPRGVAIHVPFYNLKNKEAIRPCFVGQFHRLGELFTWLSLLPDTYTGEYKHSTKLIPGGNKDKAEDHWTSVFHIFAPLRGYQAPIFDLFFRPNFERWELRYLREDPNELLGTVVAILPRAKEKFKASVFFFGAPVKDVKEAPDHLKNHPFFKLRGPLYKTQDLNEAIRRSYSPALARWQDQQRLILEARQEFAPFLIKQTKCSVRLLVSNKIGTKMIPLRMNPSCPEFLYGWTCVFPWCLNYLRLASGLVFDTTFFCLRPYTLSLLLAVIGNESLVLALSVSPTEGAGSYNRIFSYIEELIRNRKNVSVGAEVSWADDDPVVGKGTDFDDDGEEMDRAEIAALNAEGGTRTTDSETQDDLKVFSDDETEGDGAPLPVYEDDFPTPDPPAFDADLLNTLPLISDQGTALHAFVSGRHIAWKLCHRHIIQAVGPKSPAAAYVIRMLRCNNQAEYERVCRAIDVQLRERYPDQKYPKNFSYVLHMLSAKEDDHPEHILGDIRVWARFHRFSCPTTSNCIESIHARLNALVRNVRSFHQRLAIVMEYLFDRYNRRNTWVNDAFKRNKGLCYPPPDKLAESEDAVAKAKFYIALHTARGWPGPSLKREFPPEDPELEIVPRFEVHNTELEPPTSWNRTPESAGSDTAPEASAPLKRKDLHLFINGNHDTNKGRIAWDICWLVMRRTPRTKWTNSGANFAAAVFDAGKDIPLTGPSTPAEEGQWRARCDVLADSYFGRE
jgi:hypothetical protein